eukprot:7196027-Prymnesium_polylepis.1
MHTRNQPCASFMRWDQTQQSPVQGRALDDKWTTRVAVQRARACLRDLMRPGCIWKHPLRPPSPSH